MSPSAVAELVQQEQSTATAPTKALPLSKAHSNGEAAFRGLKKTEFFLDRNLHKTFPVVTGGKGNYLYLADGRTIFDATSGAAVSCLGHDNKRVIKAITDQINTGVPYLCSSFWSCSLVGELCKELINGTEGQMSRVYLTGSGTSPLNNIPLPR